MNFEIERKFLVAGEFRHLSHSAIVIRQGYLSSVPGRIVRIRTRGEQGFITVKGISGSDGISRFEWEKEIPLSEALDLLSICEPGRIEKTRYLVEYKDHVFEVDEFSGENQGLVIAEIELASAAENFEKPGWLGKEVTGDIRYYNSQLVRNPWPKWGDSL